MRVIIFNDTQNFNGSLNFINGRFGKDDKRFWNYKKYIPYILKKVSSLEGFNNITLQLVKTFFYEGRYSSNLMKNFKWSANQKIRELNQMISREQALLNMISQQKVSNMLRKKINKHVEEIKREFEEKKNHYFTYIKKQERNFKGQKKLSEELENNPLIEVKSTPLKQSAGEIHQKGVDVLIATDLVHLAHTDSFDLAIILSGDTDLVEAVKLIEILGKTPIIFSYYTQSNPRESNISDLMNFGKFINLREFTNQEIEEMSDLRRGGEDLEG